MMHKPFVITIVGPESSGKSTLAEAWAFTLGCPWVPEFAREYLQLNGPTYTEEDLTFIAEGQRQRIQHHLDSGLFPLISPDQFQGLTFGEKSAIFYPLESFGEVNRPVLIVDSGMISIRLWAKIKYGKSIPVLDELLYEDPTSLYVVCRPVLPWEADPLREAPDILDRAWIYNQYLKELGIMLRL